jgi:hypothetical protein
MDWGIQELGAMGEFVGAIAVVVTLGYLAVQIRQSRQIEMATSIRDMFVKGSEIIDYSARHPGTFEALRKGAADFSSLSVEEKETFNCWATRYIVTVEQAMYMHLDKLIPELPWRAFENLGVALIRSPGGAQWWADYNGVFGKEVTDALTAAADEPGEQRPSFYDLFPHWRY